MKNLVISVTKHTSLAQRIVLYGINKLHLKTDQTRIGNKRPLHKIGGFLLRYSLASVVTHLLVSNSDHAGFPTERK